VVQTQRIGARLAQLLKPGDVILLVGEYGSGKTILTQGIAMGLGIKECITSPTFTLINEYRPKDTGARLPLFHVDFYRLDDVAAEALALGLEEYLYNDGVTVIEWADRAMHILPSEHLLIHLLYVSETKRNVRMDPRGARYAELVREFKRQAFGV
jgi:tRNA threonylcarbamoyladenosine biosynthesis protein TsaE